MKIKADYRFKMGFVIGFLCVIVGLLTGVRGAGFILLIFYLIGYADRYFEPKNREDIVEEFLKYKFKK